MRRFFCLALFFSSAALGQQAETGVRYVFFDWGKGELTNDAKVTLDKVASDYAAHPVGLFLDGHSDRSGPASSNLARSRDRAKMVEAYLVAKGVPLSAIRVRAFGETRPIIATDDGVREVQNRRVEIRTSRD